MDAVSPLPAVGLPVVVTGGHSAAHAPEQVLFEPVSFSNRYTVRPVESTRILPRPLTSLTATVDEPAEAIELLGAALAWPLLPPPPQPATTKATSATAAAARRRDRGFLRVIFGAPWGCSVLAPWCTPQPWAGVEGRV